MATFFGNLKTKRDAPRTQPNVEATPQVEESVPSAPTGFFSALKQRRDQPTPPQDQPVDLEYGKETLQERLQRGTKDVGGQVAVGIPSSFAGSYGNIAEAIGTQKPVPEGKVGTPFGRLPTSKDISQWIEGLGGPGKATTPEGEGARRVSDIYGAGLAFGMANPLPAIVGGTAGEATKLLGGGPVAQAISEIVGMLVTQGKSIITALTSKNPLIKARIDALRNLGYTDQEITVAVNAQKAGSNRVKTAAKTSQAEQAIDSTLGKSEGLYEEVLESAFPGYGKGVEHLHDTASNAYGQVAREAKNVVVTNASRFQKTVDNVVKRLRNTLGENPETAPFIKRVEDAAAAAHANPTADTFINFYKELNKMGKWVNPKEREILITHVKNGIKSTFRNSGKQGKQLAEKFEQVNKGVQKAYQAEAVSDLLQKAHTADGLDWKKMLKLFDKQSTWETLETGLGKQQAKNLHEISKVAKEVGDFSKALGSKAGKTLLDKTGSAAPFVGAFASILTHLPKYAIVGAGIKAGTFLGKQAYSRLQTRLLTDPKFQNLTIKFMKAIKDGHPRALSRAAQDFQKVADEEGIDLNLSQTQRQTS